MRSLGLGTAVVLATAGAVAVFIGLRSIPDVRRYLKIRSM